METALFRVVANGAKIEVDREMSRYLSCKRLKVIRLVGSVDVAIQTGGTYLCERLDGPNDMMDLNHTLHRNTFQVMTSSVKARRSKKVGA